MAMMMMMMRQPPLQYFQNFQTPILGAAYAGLNESSSTSL